MTWSYNISETTDTDRVRGKIGDTNTNLQRLQDETIAAVLVLYPSVVAASVECVKRIIARIATDPDSRSAAGLSSSRGQAVANLEVLLGQLRAELAGTAEMFIGGVSDSANEALRADTNFPAPAFTVGGDDYT